LAQKAAEIGSWDWNLQTGELVWSEQIEPIFGLKKGEFEKTYDSFLEMVHPEDRQFVTESINNCIKKEAEYDIEHRIVWPDKSIHWVKEIGDIITDETGKPKRMLGIVMDITKDKETEENIIRLNEKLLSHATELEVINKELEAFSYSVSHDLRAPLRSIDGFSQAIMEDYSEKLDREGKDYLKRVKNAAQQMSDIIDDLLKLSRITQHKVDQEKIDIADLSRKIINEFKRNDSKRKIKVKIQDNLVVNGDRHLLEMALKNLISNAWKFTSKKPNAEIEIGRTKKADKDVYYIRDNGAGFDMKYAEKLFVPFQRLHKKDEFKGTGIGLGIVARIIHRHGGHIWGEAEEGKGAVFYFTIRGL
jgi:PAS domain S-box-containing protein